MREENERRWFDLWLRIGCSGRHAVDIYEELVERYSSPYRVYHTLKHINDTINELNVARRFALNSDTIEMALWFHDAVLDPLENDNEERSAELLMSVIYLPDGFKKIVANLILATKHDKMPDDFDGQFIADIDLSILGQSEEKFDEYEAGIKKEYSFVSEEVFKSERIKILSHFANRSSIYYSRFFSDRYELAAHRNLERVIKKLSAK